MWSNLDKGFITNSLLICCKFWTYLKNLQIFKSFDSPKDGKICRLHRLAILKRQCSVHRLLRHLNLWLNDANHLTKRIAQHVHLGECLGGVTRKAGLRSRYDIQKTKFRRKRAIFYSTTLKISRSKFNSGHPLSCWLLLRGNRPNQHKKATIFFGLPLDFYLSRENT